MSEICGARRAGPHGHLKQQKTSPLPAGCTVFPLHSRPPITTPRLAATTKPQHRGPLNTFCRFAAHASSWQTRRMPHRMLLGKNCRIAICTGPQPTSARAGDGHPSGSACAATPLSMNTTPCCKLSPSPPSALHMDRADSQSTCASAAEAGCVAAAPRRRSSHARASGFQCPKCLMPHPQQLLLLPKPCLPTLHGFVKAPLTRGPFNAHTAGSSSPCYTQPSAVSTPPHWPGGKLIRCMAACGSTASHSYAKRRQSNHRHWCMHCTPCSSLPPKRDEHCPRRRHSSCSCLLLSPAACQATPRCIWRGLGGLLHCLTATYRPRPRRHSYTCTLESGRRLPCYRMLPPHTGIPPPPLPILRPPANTYFSRTGASCRTQPLFELQLVEHLLHLHATASRPPSPTDTQPCPAPADHLHGPRLQAALASLDPFDAEDVLLQPCSLFRNPPPFCKPQLRGALQLSLKLIRDESSADAPDAPESLAACRAWKLFLFLPRLLLFRPAGAVRVPKPELLARFSAFSRGEWSTLLHKALAEAAAVGLSPVGPADSPDSRAQRATRLARLGELSAARQALTAEPLAPANADTLTALTDPLRRPPRPYGEMPETVTSFVPEASQAPSAGEATPPAPARGDAEHCCVCLERLLPAAQGAQPRVRFLACSRHSMHLECLAQYRAQANGPPDLLCPLCRHSRCPECAHGGWSDVHDEHLRSLYVAGN